MKKGRAILLVLFGVSGDLSRRKILPAVESLLSKHKITQSFSVLGLTRSDTTKESVLDTLVNKKHLEKVLRVETVDINKLRSYNNLHASIQKMHKNIQVIFYLSVPSENVKNIVGMIGKSDLKKIKDKKLLLEKPFGQDLASAKKLEQYMKKYFHEDETYRIDHYLLKDVSKEIIKKRFTNKALEKKWNKNFIKKVEIVASENIGIEGRVNFYEKTGALRDMVQSHLLSLLSNVLMELPTTRAETFTKKRHAALSKLHLIINNSKRAQYAGYRTEVMNKQSKTETFVTVEIESSDSRWRRVPFILATGKGLAEKNTYVRVMFNDRELIFKEKPNKAKNTYEEVLINAISGDKDFFLSDEKILESWRILEELQKNWQSSQPKLHVYPKGSKVDNLLSS